MPSHKNRRKNKRESPTNITRFVKFKDLPMEYQLMLYKQLQPMSQVESKNIPLNHSQEYKEVNTVLSEAVSQTIPAASIKPIDTEQQVREVQNNILNKPFSLVFIYQTNLLETFAIVDGQVSQCFGVFKVTREDVKRHGGNVQKAAEEKFRKNLENNSNPSDSADHSHTVFPKPYFHQQRVITDRHAHERNMYSACSGRTYSTEEASYRGCQRSYIWLHISFPDHTTGISTAQNCSNSMPHQLRRVDSVVSGRLSESGYSADYDIPLQKKEERATVRHMKLGVFPPHLQQPLGFEWEHSDSDSSNEAVLFLAVPSEDGNSEKDYTVFAFRKQNRKSKRERNSLRNWNSKIHKI